jgi:hypothetical protein
MGILSRIRNRDGSPPPGGRRGGRDSGPLPDYGLRYFEHVVAEYRTSNLGPLPDAVDAVLRRYDTDCSKLTWAELCTIEKAILQLQPFPAIKRRAWALRNNFREVIGEAAYNSYIASHPPNESEANVDQQEVRADLTRVLDALHWSYVLIPIREKLRSTIINHLASRILFSGLALTLLVWWFVWYDQRLLATLIVVAFFGCLGGFVSMLQRIGQVPTDGDPLLSIFQLNIGRATLYLSPLTGAIFAVLLFFIFLGNLVQGGLFPNLPNTLRFAWGSVLVKGTPAYPAHEYAKLVVWSFVAGFAERFVPDMLDRLTARALNQAQTPPPSPAPPYSADSSSPPASGDSSSPPAGTPGSPTADRMWSPS